jgi:hypothetical protein
MDFAREPSPAVYAACTSPRREKLDYNTNHLLATDILQRGTKCVARFPNPSRAHRIGCVGSVVNSALRCYYASSPAMVMCSQSDGEFSKTRHPQNVEFNKVLEACFSGAGNSRLSESWNL